MDFDIFQLHKLDRLDSQYEQHIQAYKMVENPYKKVSRNKMVHRYCFDILHKGHMEKVYKDLMVQLH